MSDNEPQIYLKEAETLLDQGNYEGAVLAYRKVVDLDPCCNEAWLMLGSIYGETGKLYEAVTHLQRAIELVPDNATAQHALGQVRYAMGDVDSALACLEKAVASSPDDPVVQCALGDLYREKGDIENAVAVYEKAMACDQAPEQGWAMLGYLQLQRGDPIRAEACYRNALTASPHDSAAVTGWCAAVTQIDTSDSVDVFMQQLFESNTNEPEICFQLANVNAQLGRQAEAIDCIDKALQSEPGNDLYRISKAGILQGKGDLPACFEIIKPYLESQPVNPNAVLVLAKFSHIVGLKNECIQLLQGVLASENLAPEIRTEVSAALDWVKSAEVIGTTP